MDYLGAKSICFSSCDIRFHVLFFKELLFSQTGELHMKSHF